MPEAGNSPSAPLRPSRRGRRRDPGRDGVPERAAPDGSEPGAVGDDHAARRRRDVPGRGQRGIRRERHRPRGRDGAGIAAHLVGGAAPRHAHPSLHAAHDGGGRQALRAADRRDLRQHLPAVLPRGDRRAWCRRHGDPGYPAAESAVHPGLRAGGPVGDARRAAAGDAGDDHGGGGDGARAGGDHAADDGVGGIPVLQLVGCRRRDAPDRDAGCRRHVHGAIHRGGEPAAHGVAHGARQRIERHGQHDSDPDRDGGRRRRDGDQGAVLRRGDPGRRGHGLALQRELDAHGRGCACAHGTRHRRQGGRDHECRGERHRGPLGRPAADGDPDGAGGGCHAGVQHPRHPHGHGGRRRWIGGEGGILRRHDTARRGHVLAVRVHLDADGGRSPPAFCAGDRQPERGGLSAA